MKNIHLLKTDKPSRLLKNLVDGTYQFKKEVSYGNRFEVELNTYITYNSEDINDNDYIITKDNRLVQVSYLMSKDLEDASKVVLTDNQDLIKDGVQAIDDEFLEWFVKNPSCEEIEVEKHHGINTSIAEVSSISGNDDYNWQGRGDLRDYKIIIPKEEPKQETLEEAAEKYDSQYVNRLRPAFISVSKWQQERSYSESEKGILDNLNSKQLDELELILKKNRKLYSEEELLAFGKSCFYKGFEKAEKDDANCYTAFREEIGSLVEQFKNK